MSSSVSDVYVTVTSPTGGEADDIATIRVLRVAGETVRSLLLRCLSTEARADAPLPPDVIELLRRGYYTLAPLDDANQRFAHTNLVPDAMNDFFAVPYPVIEVYVHGADCLLGILAGRSIRVRARSGVTTPADLLEAFLLAPQGTRTPAAESEDLFVAATDDSATATPFSNTEPLSWITPGSDFFVLRRPSTTAGGAATTITSAQKATAGQNATSTTTTTTAKKTAAQAPRRLSIASLTPELEQTLSAEEVLLLLADARRENVQRRGIALARRMLDGSPRYRIPSDPKPRADLLSVLATLLVEAKRFSAAADALREAIDLVGDDDVNRRAKLLRTLGMMLFDCKEYQQAVAPLQEYHGLLRRSPTAAEKVLRDAQIRLGGAMYMAGYGDAAVHMVQSTLAGDASDTLGVCWMTRFYADRGHQTEAVTWSVQTLVRNYKVATFGPLARETFLYVARKLGTPAMLQGIQSIINVPPEPNTDLASVIGYLGLVARDHSLLDLSIPLYRLALRVGSSPIMILNCAHTLENDGDIVGALRVIQDGLVGLGPLAVRGLSARTVAAAMGDLNELDESYPVRTRVACERLAVQRPCVRVDRLGRVLLFDDVSEAQKVPPGNTSGYSERDTGVCRYGGMELDLLGLYVAAVKDLFLLGLLDRVVKLVPDIALVTENANLHRSLMRNEAAYFSTVTLLMQYLDPVPAADAQASTQGAIVGSEVESLYVVGDSHCLSLAWHTVPSAAAFAFGVAASSSSSPSLLFTPALVTGCKIWHLRDESDFYTRHAFSKVVSSIPMDSHIMFLLGEIDCREGIVQTVEKGIYDTAAEAIDRLLHMYWKVVLRVKHQRQLRFAAVHTPPASLDVTRNIVTSFNAALTEFLSTRAPAVSVKVLCVDPCTLADGALLPQYQLDGTHISPTYLLDGTLVKCIKDAVKTLTAE